MGPEARVESEVGCLGATTACRPTQRGSRVFFFSASRSTPTANADGPCRSEGTCRDAQREPFPKRYPQTRSGPLCSPSACAEKGVLRIDPCQPNPVRARRGGSRALLPRPPRYKSQWALGIGTAASSWYCTSILSTLFGWQGSILSTPSWHRTSVGSYFIHFGCMFIFFVG